jgi:hypothetical protein
MRSALQLGPSSLRSYFNSFAMEMPWPKAHTVHKSIPTAHLPAGLRDTCFQCCPVTWFWGLGLEGPHHSQKWQDWHIYWNCLCQQYAEHLLSYWESGISIHARQNSPCDYSPKKLDEAFMNSTCWHHSTLMVSICWGGELSVSSVTLLGDDSGNLGLVSLDFPTCIFFPLADGAQCPFAKISWVWLHGEIWWVLGFFLV